MTVTNVITSTDIGNIPGTVAKHITVVRSGIPSQGCGIRKSNPFQANGLKILMGSGGSGIEYFEDTDGGTELILDALELGYTIYQRKWDNPWFTTGASMVICAGRYNDLVNWCCGESAHIIALGNSGGAGEIGYALSRYNNTKINKAILCSGPPFTRLDWVCQDPPTQEWQSLFNELNTLYLSPWTQPIDLFGAPQLCPNLSTMPGYPTCLEPDSIASGNLNLSAQIRTILGTQDTSVGVSHGILYYSLITANKALYTPDAPHLITATQAGRDAILSCL